MQDTKVHATYSYAEIDHQMWPCIPEETNVCHLYLTQLVFYYCSWCPEQLEVNTAAPTTLKTPGA